jgi:ABC-type sugar transport system substrate-binding protein
MDKLLAEARRAPDGVWCDSGLQGVGSLQRFADGGGAIPAHTGGDLNGMYKLCLHNRVPMAALDYPASMGARALELALDVLGGSTVPQRVEEPVRIVLPRGCETQSVRADIWAERHVAWDLGNETILSQGPALRDPRPASKRNAS